MQVVTDIAILADQRPRFVVNDKFAVHSTAVGGFVVSIRYIADGDALRTMFTPNPIRIGQIDANGR